MSGLSVPSLTWSRMSGQRDPMRQPQFMRSTTFRWALAVAGVLAVFVIVLFGFIYWKTDDYLIARSDIMIARQLNYLSGLSGESQRCRCGKNPQSHKSNFPTHPVLAPAIH